MKKISAFPSLLLLMICALGLMTCVVGAQIPDSLTNGLVAYYPFDGNANDMVGTNNGTVFGATLTANNAGTSNSAYYFSNFNYIALPSTAPPNSNSRTLSLWVAANSWFSPDGFVDLMINQGPGTRSDGAQFGIQVTPSGLIRSTVYTSNGEFTDDSTNVLSTSLWHQIAQVWDGVNEWLYLKTVS